MASSASTLPKHILGRWGEDLIAARYACPRCKRPRTLRRLPTNFRCADIICDFCGYLAQVKTSSVADVTRPPRSILGAAWKPQRDRMRAGIYFPLYIVLRSAHYSSVFYLPTEFQLPKIFRKRAPLSKTARRAGWQGFTYELWRLEREVPIRLEVLSASGKPLPVRVVRALLTTVAS